MRKTSFLVAYVYFKIFPQYYYYEKDDIVGNMCVDMCNIPGESRGTDQTYIAHKEIIITVI